MSIKTILISLIISHVLVYTLINNTDHHVIQLLIFLYFVCLLGTLQIVNGIFHFIFPGWPELPEKKRHLIGVY